MPLVTLEHLGCSEWADTADRGYHATGEPDFWAVWTTQGKVFELVRDATVVQDPFGFGYESVKTMAGLAKGEKYAGAKLRGVMHRIVTNNGGPGRLTVAQYRAEEAKKAGR